MGIVESFIRYGKWSTRVKPWWIVFPNQAKIIPSKQKRWIALDNGCQFAVRPNTRDLNEVMAVGLGWEYRGIIEAGVVAPRCIFDLGGHIGVFSVWIKQIFPEAEVIVLEPNPDNHSLLQDNINSNGIGKSTQVIRGAVTSKDRKVDLFLAHHNNAHSLVQGGKAVTEKAISVDGFSLSGLVAKYAPHGDFAIKMDIEGAEYDVLAASRDVVGKSRFVVMEWHFQPHEKKEKWKWLTNYFFELGFKCRELSDRTALWMK